MRVPWYLKWLMPNSLQEQVHQVENQRHRRLVWDKQQNRKQQRRQRVRQYLDTTFTNYQPLIERTYPYRFFCIERDRLMASKHTTKGDMCLLSDKIIKRGEAAALLAYYDQHFPPGSRQHGAFSLREHLDSLNESLELIEYLDEIQRIANRQQQVLVRLSGGNTVTVLTPAGMSDYRKQMRTAYEAVRKQVHKQAFPGASATVLADEVENRWNDWQQQNGVFATITRSALSPGTRLRFN